jgi:UDP-hydrolysing UDP-N-acetyl-D-glucosamine 2-epimerase
MRLCAISTNRADWSSLRPIVRRAALDSRFEISVLVAGGIDEQSVMKDLVVLSDDPNHAAWGPLLESVELSASWLSAFTVWLDSQLGRIQPEAVVVVGDRIELLTVSQLCLLKGIPLAHVSGGDTTLGALDEQVRNAVSCMAQVHFVAHETHRVKLEALAIKGDRIFIVGDPALDDLPVEPASSRTEFLQHFGLPENQDFALLTYHPPTASLADLEIELTAILGALRQSGIPVLATGPNGDPGSDVIRCLIHDFVSESNSSSFVTSLGQDYFYDALHFAMFMVGNSSSGLWEAPNTGLPVINVGSRQAGRLRASNVTDASTDLTAIVEVITSIKERKQQRTAVNNPFRQYRSTESILDTLIVALPSLPVGGGATGSG